MDNNKTTNEDKEDDKKNNKDNKDSNKDDADSRHVKPSPICEFFYFSFLSYLTNIYLQVRYATVTKNNQTRACQTTGAQDMPSLSYMGVF